MFISPNHFGWKRWMTAVGLATALSAAPLAAQSPGDAPRGRRPREAWSDPDNRPPHRTKRDRRTSDAPGDTPRRPGREDARLGRGPRGGRPGGPDGPPPWRELDPEQRQQVIKFVEDHFPELWVEMSDLRDRNRNLFRQRMKRLLPDFARLMETVRRDPEKGALLVRERQLHLRIRYLARDYRAETAEPRRQEMRKQMHELCGQAFDCEVQRRAMEVRELEARLAMFKERITEQERMREALITKRAERALNQDWPGPPGPPGRREQRGRPRRVENKSERE